MSKGLGYYSVGSLYDAESMSWVDTQILAERTAMLLTIRKKSYHSKTRIIGMRRQECTQNRNCTVASERSRKRERGSGRGREKRVNEGERKRENEGDVSLKKFKRKIYFPFLDKNIHVEAIINRVAQIERNYETGCNDE